MNIIKFKDIVLEYDEEATTHQYTQEFVELFNQYFRNKYCYWPDCMIAVPFNELSHKEYIDLSRLLMVKGTDELVDDWAVEHYIITNSDVQSLVDMEKTVKANSIRKFSIYNEYLPDDDITVDELKKFRTWLATTLLMFDQENNQQLNEIFTEDQTHTLQYYANHMYDDVVKYLSSINTTTTITTPTSTKCGCSNNISLSNIFSLNTCDPVYLYKKSMYNSMVKMFSNIDFWVDFDEDFLLDVKKYIDGIIKCGFPLYQSEYVSELVDCTCVNNVNSKQIELQNILKNLSTSFEYIANGDITGHRNLIGPALNLWATKLYELMEW